MVHICKCHIMNLLEIIVTLHVFYLEQRLPDWNSLFDVYQSTNSPYCLTRSVGFLPSPSSHFRVEHPPSGRFMECKTTEPGLQFYTGVNLNVPGAKGGAVYQKFGAFCLEAQHYPDSVNHVRNIKIHLKIYLVQLLLLKKLIRLFCKVSR